MFNITILAIGKIKEAYFREAIGEYLKRLRPYAKIDVQELAGVPFSGKDKEAAKVKEGERICRFLDLRRESRVFVLDEHGDMMNSIDLSRLLSAQTAPLIFIVGGALGLDKTILDRADRLISLSRLTMPHELARLVLVEQIYRAAMIDKGKTYHY